MNSVLDSGQKQPISKEEAVGLLYGKEEIAHSERNCFDEFGNYVFPTDLVANTPNTAVGTSSGLSFINEICLY